MSLEVTVKNDQFPDDYEFDVRGLGLFKNGETRTVSDEEEAAFLAVHGRTVREAAGNSATVSVKGRATVKNEDGES